MRISRMTAALALAALMGPSGVTAAWPAQQPAVSSPEEARQRLEVLEGLRRELVEERDAIRAGGAAEREAQAERLSQIEQRLREIEAEMERLGSGRGARAGAETPLDPQGLTPLDVTGGAQQVTAGTAFNPAISVIPDGVFYQDSRRGRVAEILAGADGFGAHEAEEGHAPGAVGRGFNLRELEVTFSGAVDPYFEAWAVLAVGGGEIEAEEAYVQTRALLPGLQARFGKFFSGFGYINRQHPHQWDFVDQALPYDLLVGGSLGDVGVQVTWLPVLPVYLQAGFEALQGENEGVASYLGPEADERFRDVPGPRLLAGFVKVAPDLGYSQALQAGFSLARSRAHQELHEEEGEALDGHVTLLGADVVYRFDSGKALGLGDVLLQGEYLRRLKRLDVAGTPGPTRARASSTQDGLYAQVVYGFAPRWTAAFRIEGVGLTNRVEEDDERLDLDSSRRYAFNVTFNPTEFSRLRLQYTRGDVASGGAREPYNQVWVQLQVSLGAHGAHTF